MDIIEYTSFEFESCIELFMSNLDKFFDDSELNEYKDFLKSEALENNYFVVKENLKTVGAGGFFLYKNVYWLDWGMIHRSKHGQGVGAQLLKFRINKICEECANAKIKLCTSQHTVGFYEKFGFEVLNITENGYGLNLHKYELEKKS